ncbi:MAG: hypothetical protein K5739_10270 [Lachnospiraceae bacterium]|nr:hypothetical protein [Lachnospiraceae bacterium]
MQERELEERIRYLEENVIKEDIDQRGITTGIPFMKKKDYYVVALFAAVCLILIIVGGFLK